MNRKRLITLTVLLLALASNSAQAWFFFFLPGSVTGAISDAITGSEGNNCVGSTVKVGDTIRLTDGSRGVVKSLSGTSSRCTNPEFPIRALLELSKDSTANDVSIFNSKAGIELPEGWKPAEVSAQLKSKGYFFLAKDESKGEALLLASVTREGITDMMAHVASVRSSQMKMLSGAKQSDIEKLQVNGMSAWRFEVTGMPAGRSVNSTYLITLIDTGKELVSVAGMMAPVPGLSEREQRADLSNLAYRITLNGQSTTVTGPPTPVTTAPPAPATPNPPVVTTPPEPTAVGPEQTPNRQGSIATRLQLLDKLYKDGLITEKDFESKKQEILRGL